MIKSSVVNAPQQSRQHDTSLVDRAKTHWPNNESYRLQWIRMVHILRAGRGWVLEGGKVDWHATQR